MSVALDTLLSDTPRVPKIGRPSAYTLELAEEICTRIATTPRGLDSICRSDSSLPDPRTINRWVLNNPEFRRMYYEAREQQASLLFDECLEISDNDSEDLKIIGDKAVANSEFIARSALRVKTRLHMAGVLSARLAPRNVVTGAKGGPIEVEHTHTHVTLDLLALDPDQRDTLRDLLLAARAGAALDVTPRGEGE